MLIVFDFWLILLFIYLKQEPMKAILLFSLFVLTFSFNSYSQIERHTFMVGGSLTINSYKPQYSSSILYTTYNIHPIGGYFVVKNLAIGLGYRFSGSNNSVKQHSITPFLRYYVKKFYVQTSYGYSKSLVGEYKLSGSFLGFDLGYAAFLNDNVAIEPAIYFNQSYQGSKNAGQNFGFKIGIQVYLNR